ncbi:MAG: CIA30 family protein [Bacteroidetes bacterium]|nr:MAG: CIA30 family protein [Bacteroidota bacterium]
MQAFFQLFICFAVQQFVLFDFNKDADMRNWNVVDDGVMGGLSAGRLRINEAGHAAFTGTVSLENNGGFSSLRYYFKPLETSSQSKFLIRLKGDGKNYQFRVKSRANEYYSYICDFKTSGDWQTIEIPFDILYPSFRGRTLNMPNYPGKQLGEIGFLIGNKKEESFRLELDKIMIE